MTNPNNSIGTNGAFGGRTSVNAFNDVMGGFSRGILSGWACNPNSGLTVSIGGDGVHRDVAIAEDNAGNKTSINNIGNSPVNVTIGAAPGTNSRIDAIVAYVDNPPSGTDTVTDNPSACGLIVVQGTTSLAPMSPSDAQIRTAITADGASGTTAYYVVLAYITMASGTTDITSGEITAGDKAILEVDLDINSVGTDSIEDGAVTSDKIDFSTISSWGSMQTASQRINFVGASHITLNRIGNIVFVSETVVWNNGIDPQDGTVPETIPAGYRPIEDGVACILVSQTIGSPGSSQGVYWYSYGENIGHLAITVAITSTPWRGVVTGVWLTNDDWPTS